jgi:hypothetical protein
VLWFESVRRRGLAITIRIRIARQNISPGQASKNGDWARSGYFTTLPGANVQQLCPDKEEAGDIFVYRNLRMWRAHRVWRLGEHYVLDQRLDMGMLF